MNIRDVSSSNVSIASLKNGNIYNGQIQQVQCIDCRAYYIECNKKGQTTLTAKNNYNDTITATVNVT